MVKPDVCWKLLPTNQDPKFLVLLTDIAIAQSMATECNSVVVYLSLGPIVLGIERKQKGGSVKGRFLRMCPRSGLWDPRIYAAPIGAFFCPEIRAFTGFGARSLQTFRKSLVTAKFYSTHKNGR